MIGVYAIRSLVSGKMYVGSSNNIARRFREHKGKLRSNKHKSRHLQFAWNKYGEDAFEFVVLLQCPKNMLAHYEQQFLDEWKPEYNTNPHADRPMPTGKHSEETKRNIAAGMKSEVRKAWNASRKGKDVRSPEHKAKMLMANLGKKKSPESNLARSMAQKGITRSPEFKTKVSAGRLGKKYPRNK